MPRSLSSGLQTQVSADATKTAFLIELNLSTTVRLTDYYRNVTYDSNSYEAGGSFLQVGSTTETGKLEVNEIDIQLSNVTNSILQLVQDGSFTNKTVDVYLAYFDTDENLVGAINYFTGQIRHIAISESIDQSSIVLTVASHWANWNLTKGRHYSDESQQNFSSGDKGLEYATQSKKDVIWSSD
tara:strand:+ start:432 stop:983 length:552 start_codon:yes stop_codon:yes gene_type:complete